MEHIVYASFLELSVKCDLGYVLGSTVNVVELEDVDDGYDSVEYQMLNTHYDDVNVDSGIIRYHFNMLAPIYVWLYPFL